MNPIQKQLLGLGAAVMLAMLIFPPWTKITHHVVMGLGRSTAQTETQEFAGYSPLFEPPQTRSLAAYQTTLMPGDYYESVEIDFDLFLLQWLTVAFLTAAGLLYFKGSDKKSLHEWWSGVTAAAKSRPTTNPPKPPVLRQAAPISETQVPTDVGSSKQSESTPPGRMSPWKRADKAFGFGFFVGVANTYWVKLDISSSDRMLLAGIFGVVVGLVAYLVAVVYYAGKGQREVAVQTDATKARKHSSGLVWVGGIIGFIVILSLIANNQETKTAQENPNSSAASQVEKPNNAADAETQAAAQFEKDFYEKYPDLKPHGPVVDAVALKLQASGYRGESREAVMETIANAAREELADTANQIATEAERKAAEEKEKARADMELAAKGDPYGLLRMGERYRDGDGVEKDLDKARDYFSKGVLRLTQDEAAKGNPYDLLRMGERYRDGDGVEKDLTKAKEYFNKAIAAGSPTAAEELKKLNDAVGK